MSIILFLVILAILVFVHELGHFLVAKKSGIRVDEFAIGFPPKIFSWVKGETKYVLNLIPFGGYVKIFGENPDEESITGPDSKRSFVNSPKWKQVSVLVAGVSMNVIFAWILLSISLMIGNIMPIGQDGAAKYLAYSKDVKVLVTGVAPNSMAEKIGIQAGDSLFNVSSFENTNIVSSTSPITISRIKEIVEKSNGKDIYVSYIHSNKIKYATTTATLINNKFAIGVYMDTVGIVKMNPFRSIWYGADLTVTSVKDVAVGLVKFIGSAVKGKANMDDVTGPVGLIGMVGQAAQFGFTYLLGFVAFISLNLAVINLLPFPALDGGRILFVLIEAIIRRPIKPIIANTLNGLGFFLLIGLMFFITIREVFIKFF